jgi:hypothetical protein
MLHTNRGAGAAMAQVEGGNIYPVAPIAQPVSGGLIRSGSSDVAPANPASVIPNWQSLPTYGGQG